MKTVRRPPYPKWNPGYFPCSSLTPLPLSSRRPSVSFGGFGLSIYLVSGFQLKGEIVDFDEETILINHKNVHQLVMRSGVASMYPLPGSKAGAEEWWRDHVPPSVEE